MTLKNEPSDQEIGEIKRKLKAGKLDKEDLDALEALVERSEHATKKLRAAIVE